jgi:hypothetical protein
VLPLCYSCVPLLLPILWRVARLHACCTLLPSYRRPICRRKIQIWAQAFNPDRASLYKNPTDYRSSAGPGLLIGRAASKLGAVILQQSAPMETKMRKRVLSIFGVLVIAALTIQMATAAPRSARKAARAHAPVTHQVRDAFGSAPAAVHSRSCDIFACYED